MESHAAAMIKRFREGKPMSRAERQKSSAPASELWWIDKDTTVGTETGTRLGAGTDDFEFPRPSPLKPTKKDETWEIRRSPARPFPSASRPISPFRKFDNLPLSLRDSQIDDLISDDIDENFFARSPKIELESPKKKTRSSRMIEDDLFGSLRFSREETRQRHLVDSIDTLGTIGFKSLLAPNLKLDGKPNPPPPPPAPDNKAELDNLTSNLEGLLKSFNIPPPVEDSIPKTEYDVPLTITQVTNKLTTEMLQFTSNYNMKYSEEDSREKELKSREKELKELGRQEAQAKIIMEQHYFDLSVDDWGGYSLDIHPEKKGEENGAESEYRHHLYDKSHWIASQYHQMSLPELSSKIQQRRVESFYHLHCLDPPAAWYHPRFEPQGPTEEEETKEKEVKEIDLSGLDILSLNSINHRTITAAAKDTITCCLNATMNTLSLRLPSEEEIARQQLIENEIQQRITLETDKLNSELLLLKTELQQKEAELLEKVKESSSQPIIPSIPPSSPAPPTVEIKNSLKKEELDHLDQLLGPEEKETLLLKEVLTKKDSTEAEILGKSQKRTVYFQSPLELEQRISSRGDPSAREIQKYIYPSRIIPPDAPKPSAPTIPIGSIPVPPTRSGLSDAATKSDREIYLKRMKQLRQQMMS